MKKNNDIQEAQALHQAGELQKAKQSYLEILNQDPHNIDALHFLAILYAEEGEFDLAQVYLRKALTLEPHNKQLLLHLANILKAQSLYDEAIEVLQSAIKQYPTFAALFNNLGTVYFAQNKFSEAAQAYQAAIDIQPNYADAYYNLGLAQKKLGNITQAKNTFSALLELSKEHPGAYFQIALLLMQQEKYEEAIKCFLKIAEKYPHHFETQTNLATSYLKQGLLIEARERYRKALALNPKDLQTIFNLGIINMHLGQTAEAVQYYLQAVKIDPDFFDSHNNLGFIFLVMKNTQDALHHFREALRIQPNNDAIRHTINILTQKKNLPGSPPAYIRALFDSYADHFDLHLKGALQYQVPTLFFKTIEKRRNKNTEKWDILDLGCGTGLTGELLKPFAKTITGIDLSSKMLEVAAQKNIYDQLIESDIVPFLEQKRAAYDLILAADVFVYFGELSDVFKAVSQALKPKGLFLFNAEIDAHQNYVMTPAGRFAHSKKYLDELATSNNFEIVEYREVVLRKQDKDEVKGHLYLLCHPEERSDEGSPA